MFKFLVILFAVKLHARSEIFLKKIFCETYSSHTRTGISTGNLGSFDVLPSHPKPNLFQRKSTVFPLAKQTLALPFKALPTIYLLTNCHIFCNSHNFTSIVHTVVLYAILLIHKTREGNLYQRKQLVP